MESNTSDLDRHFNNTKSLDCPSVGIPDTDFSSSNYQIVNTDQDQSSQPRCTRTEILLTRYSSQPCPTLSRFSFCLQLQASMPTRSRREIPHRDAWTRFLSPNDWLVVALVTLSLRLCNSLKQCPRSIRIAHRRLRVLPAACRGCHT